MSNLERAIRFYRDQLGMKLLFKTPIEETGGRVAWLRSKGSSQILELNWYPKGYKYGGKKGLDHLAFEVGNLDKAYSKLTRRVRGTIKPFKEGSWMLAYVTDSEGNWIELGQRLKRRK